MTTVRVTFYLGQSGLPAWLIKGIHQQVREFEGESELIKVHSLQRVNVRQYLNALTFAFQPDDLCQIILTGDKAQNYAFLLKAYLQKHCTLLEEKSFSEPSYDPLLGQKPDKTHFKFDYIYIPEKMNRLDSYRKMAFTKQASKVNKASIIKRIAKIASIKNHKKIEPQLEQREQLSSTGMQAGIALPHIISEYISQPTMVCLTSNTAIDWHSPHGPVTHIITLLLPKPCNKEAVLSIRHLVVNLMSPEKKLFITEHHTAKELQAILTCFMMPTH